MYWKLPCRRERSEQCHPHSVRKSHNQAVYLHTSDDIHQSMFYIMKTIKMINLFIIRSVVAVAHVNLRFIYPAIFTVFKMRILALSNSRFTTHALAAIRSTSIAILSYHRGEQKPDKETERGKTKKKNKKQKKSTFRNCV